MEFAPASIVVPSGNNIKLDYTSGETPVLAVKLQEMFGLDDTPIIANGRVKVLIHLLSPARSTSADHAGPQGVLADRLSAGQKGTEMSVSRDVRGLTILERSTDTT